jgi:hypothetical protein
VDADVDADTDVDANANTELASGAGAVVFSQPSAQRDIADSEHHVFIQAMLTEDARVVRRYASLSSVAPTSGPLRRSWIVARELAASGIP